MHYKFIRMVFISLIISSFPLISFGQGLINSILRPLFFIRNQQHDTIDSSSNGKEDYFDIEKQVLLENKIKLEESLRKARNENNQELINLNRVILNSVNEALEKRTTDDFFRFLIVAPDQKTVKNIITKSRLFRQEIYQKWFNMRAPTKQDPRIVIQVTIDPDRDILHQGTEAGGFWQNYSGGPYCRVEGQNEEGCLYSLRHELTHAIHQIELEKKFPNARPVAAIDEGIAEHEDDKNLTETYWRILGWYPLTGSKIPHAREILDILKLTSSDYTKRAYTFVFVDYLLTKGSPSKIINFESKYLETKNWDEAVKVYDYRNLEQLNQDFQKWLVKRLKKINE